MNSNDWIPFKWDKEKENWLDCQLGEDEEEVLVTYLRNDGSKYVDIDIFMFDDQWYLDSGCAFVEEAIAWMPLPRPYSKPKKRKTYGEDFLGNFPHAPTINGRPKACREEIYKYEPEQCNDCEKCWGEEMEKKGNEE